ncbi:hypothetical protein A3F07_01565 [candidate division WWE3 bacterium RIFCSPHIGHO2_12_FULL_38_15]|uniref:Diacylglycerol glucosyltransferase N-terminal domain-containing protein n=1 Tax=candidate division WWE3 bacterium RIFCSPHIGHO2_02_FULL_38_14 TaxID=1802620 RepID=A0A1F4V8Q3_UNCKA|nr:MAG: hypothetical protein A2793_01735 [candidate division WWE3 bacterium RIFCSPHIGHO2_01_FULL_38_45]OGC48393.1 MAG: hypothetical protein A3F07_01565 [candidate division WWE3 bacterium RIFCSPHIGHO2_12_FULL_38_15]OGC53631.1 MAG: hypothetical protein A3D91_04290 [candidate division WWE3 bacterium RIFCSPHIGHO2_02_FULL_38_14]OGC54327.1 MAG: hypothetical protein A3B64_02360 [candidate division WWE3 bacterium RIFCSPLOWO2_01_FULL_37_24]HLB51571.1 hypothetical protein [Patescibacteria group bacterium
MPVTAQKFKNLTDDKTIIIMAYAKAGLGHLRVTNALYNELPKESFIALLRSSDSSTEYLHRITSSHSFTRSLMEKTQNGLLENIFTKLYKAFLKDNTDMVYNQISAILTQRMQVPNKVVIVATHFGLAHQISYIKKRLEKENNLKMYLIVQVTDDSPQKVWYVEGADLIFTPSLLTKVKLEEYAQISNKKEENKKPKIIASTYPLAPDLFKNLTDREFEEKINQADISKSSEINIMVPISGAAVGMDFYIKLLPMIHSLNNRSRFYLVVKQAPFTKDFINKISNLDYVKVFTSGDYRDIVDIYDELYKLMTFSIEISKPSEQAFKCLLNPSQRGGVFMFFANPVGRQEFDNLAYLRREKLIPSEYENKLLWKNHNTIFDNKSAVELIKTSRGLELPFHSEASAVFINKCLNSGLLKKSLEYQKFKTFPKGTEIFWNKVDELLEKNPPPIVINSQ